MNELAKPGKEKNYFYTFGWSGLLSQHRRCLEAIRFYNALSLELTISSLFKSEKVFFTPLTNFSS